jgi:hypothetical protein
VAEVCPRSLRYVRGEPEVCSWGLKCLKGSGSGLGMPEVSPRWLKCARGKSEVTEV